MDVYRIASTRQRQCNTVRCRIGGVASEQTHHHTEWTNVIPGDPLRIIAIQLPDEAMKSYRVLNDGNPDLYPVVVGLSRPVNVMSAWR